MNIQQHKTEILRKIEGTQFSNDSTFVRDNISLLFGELQKSETAFNFISSQRPTSPSTRDVQRKTLASSIEIINNVKGAIKILKHENIVDETQKTELTGSINTFFSELEEKIKTYQQVSKTPIQNNRKVSGMALSNSEAQKNSVSIKL